jgi:acyl dehydratase
VTASWPASIELRCGPVGAIDLALYAAASGDHNPLHLDADVARAAGFERPVVHGMWTMACVARLFTLHFGALAVRSLSTRFVGVALRGDALMLSATLEDHDDRTARYTVHGRNAAGTDVVTGNASVQVDSRS